ncbi:MAG: hypothetical protein KME17_23655 [Cyanosarcina radialis HA8281-LM2]|jgi:hypothetical protein|nr:hypothetical protein [Cyanosarcina radialis HA8281-LM2]
MKTQQHEAESATFWFVRGENDALAALPPQHPDCYYYMMGWHDAKYEISLGIIRRKKRYGLS